MKLRRTSLYPLTIQNENFDFPLLVTVCILVVFGLIMVYDASIVHAFRDFGDSYFYIKQQLIWVGLGLICGSFFVFFDYNLLRRFAGLAFFSSLVLILAVFIPGLGSEAGGANRWLNLGFATLQPTEILKLTSVLWLAAFFEKNVGLKLPLLLLFCVGAVLGVLQKDLGSTIVFTVMSAIIYLVSGGSLKNIIAFIPFGIVAISALIFTSQYRLKRVLAFFDPFSDPQGYSYHISQVLIALGSGGLFGLGLGQSRQKFYIPEVTTDSIFSIVGEELGFLGATVLIFLFVFLIIRGLKIAEKVNDRFGKILAVGLTSWLGVQAIVNLGAMVSLFPLTGVPLPFISYGGSALVANLAAVGILLNISRNSK